jgi:hypothetical protein
MIAIVFGGIKIGGASQQVMNGPERPFSPPLPSWMLSSVGEGA